MASLGHQVDVVCSIGPFSVSFSDMPLDEGRDYAIMWNEEMAGAQKKYPGRLWASAAVPLQDTRVAIEVESGARHEKFVRYPKGDPENPLTWAELEAKFRSLAGAVLAAEQCDEIIRRMATLQPAALPGLCC